MKRTKTVLTVVFAVSSLLATQSAGNVTANRVSLNKSNDGAIVDIAAFARKMTWDPACREIKVGRVEEFPPEYVFPGKEVVAEAGGLFTVPVWKDNQSCIGLEWLERRDIEKLELQFADMEQRPAAEDIKVECWHAPSGQESIWQGKWLPLNVTVTKPSSDRLVFDVNFEIQKDDPIKTLWRGNTFVPLPGFMKVRWIFPPSARAIKLKGISAYSKSSWQTMEIAIEQAKSGETGHAEIEIYNGRILSPSDANSQIMCHWDMSEKLLMKLCCSQPQMCKSDRTLLWFRLPEAAFGVAIEDLITHGCVYVPYAGVFVTKASDPIDLPDYRTRIAGRKTVLERVHEMPDQTIAGAMNVFDDIQNYSPTFLALVCHNRKFHVRRSGIINYSTFDYLHTADMPTDFLIPQFAAHEDEDAARFFEAKSFDRSLAYPKRPSPQQSERDRNTVRRHLHGDWMPIQVLNVKEGGLIYSQCAFVAPWNKCPKPFQSGWTNQKAVCVSEFTIENPQAEPADAKLTLSFVSFQDADKNHPRMRADIRTVSDGAIVIKNDKLASFINISSSKQFSLEISGGNVILQGSIPAKTRVSCTVYLPGWDVDIDEYAQLNKSPQMLLKDTEAYWNDVMADTTAIEIPDELFENIIKASVMYLLATTRHPQSGHLAPWAAAWVYGPIENEAQVIIHGMDLMNRNDFSLQCLDYYLSLYNDAGALTTGYTLMGTGWNLWTIAEHYRLTRNDDWFGANAPKLAKACEWITRQCRKTKSFDVHGNKVPEYGLFPPGVTGDWSRFGYRFYLQAHNHDGLGQISELLSEFNYPGADGLRNDAAEFRQNILRAYKWAQERNPVLAMPDGTWVPPYPAVVDGYGRVSDMDPSGNRAAESYDVEHGSQHLAAAFDLLEPHSDDVNWMVNHLEDVCFLHDNGTECYEGQDNQRNWFDKGGFSKYQPAHSRIVRIHGLRDDVKAVIRSNFNEIPAGFDSENLSFWEHPCATAAWNKTHTTGRMVAQARQMFVMEKGNQLWLAPFVPNHYLKDGRKVSVKNAPTHFGHTNYVITSSVNKGFIEATIDPPTRNAPDEIIIRIRHPEGKLMRSVFVNDEPYVDFNAEKEYVRLKPSEKNLKVRAEFGPP
jgi:hypothetical protein